MLLMLIIEPPSPAAIRVPISAVSRNAPLRFTPMTLSNSSSLTPLARAACLRVRSWPSTMNARK